MNKKILLLVIALILTTSLAGKVSGAADPGDYFEILTLGVGSRPFGMGSTYVAISDDINAVYWNPAGLGMLDRKEFSGMWSQYFNYEYVAYVHPVENVGCFGISGYYYQYQENTNEFESIWDTAVMLSYGKEINDNTSLGISTKLLRKTLEPYDLLTSTSETRGASGIDFGILYRASEGIYLAGVIQNFSTSILQSSTTLMATPWLDLPLTFRLGASVKMFDEIVTLGFDLNIPAGEETYFSFGGEYWILNWIALRAGYNARKGEKEGLHFGLGVGNENLHLDWIWVPFKGLTARINRISMTWRFGREYRYSMIESNIEKHFKKGRRYYYRGEMVKAYNEFKNVLELIPGHKDASDYLARTEVRLDEYDTSQEIADYFENGKKYYLKGDLVRSRFEFDSLLLIEPGHKGARDYLGRIHKKADELIANQLKKGIMYYDRGDYRIARNHVNNVLSFKPDHKEAIEYNKLINDKLVRVSEALEKQKEQREGKWKAVSDYYRGLALFNLGQWTESIKVFEGVLKYNPEHEGSLEYLGKAKVKAANKYYDTGLSYFKKGVYDTAIKEFRKSLKYVPDNSKIKNKIKEANDNIKKENIKKAEKYYSQGLVSYTQGNTVAAIKVWKLAIKLDPGNETIKNALKRAQEEIKIIKEAD